MASAKARRLFYFSVVAALLLVPAAAFLLLPILRAHRTLSQASRDTASAHLIPFRFGPLAPSPNPGFEPIAAPSSFTSAAALDDRIFLAGPSALLVFNASGTNASGTLERTFHVGLDLPPSALGPLLVARLRNQAHPQLLVATAGSGILVFDPQTQSFEALLPTASGLRDITALAALASGELLAGTRRSGLLVFDGKTLELFRPEYANANITTLLAEGNDLWAGTQDHGLFHTHAGITEHIETELPDPHIEALAADATRVFAATPLGVALFEDGRPSRTLAPNTFAHALFAEPNTLTLSTLTSGVVSLPLDSSRPHATTASEDDASPTEQFVSLPGRPGLYAVRHDGLYRRAGARWVAALQPALPAPTPAALTDNHIAALNFSPDGRLWVGTFDRGLDILDLARNTAQHLEDDHLFCINRIALDPERHTMAVATANGLVLFDASGKPRQTLTRRDGLISDHITDVVYTNLSTNVSTNGASGQARMTIATPAGLTFIDSTGVQSLYAFQGLVNNHVYALAASSDGNDLLAGTLGGVSLLTHQAVRRNLTVANSGLRHNWITAALPFDNGTFLVGTYGAGIMRLDNGASTAGTARTANTARFTPLDLVTRDMVINPNAMLATSTHILAGSLGQGLWSFSRATQHWTQMTAGLPSLNVTAFAARDGILYVGTENGLVRIPESNLPQ